MFNTLIRSAIVYIFLITGVRLMGKRQIGELQPSELVITILLSEVVAIPIQDGDYPLFLCFLSVMLLITLEILFSVITLKKHTARTVLQGNSVLVINDGKILYKHIKAIRYSVEDLLEALRLKDVFDISQVQYAYIETNGSVSVQLKPQYRPVTSDDLKIKQQNEESMPCLVVCDGKIIDKEFEICNTTRGKIEELLKLKKLSPSDILLMTIDKEENTFIVKKDGDTI